MMRRVGACAPRGWARRGRRARFWWVTAAVVFLTAVGVVLWLWVRTRAGVGYGYGRWEYTLEDAPAMAGDLAAAGRF